MEFGAHGCILLNWEDEEIVSTARCLTAVSLSELTCHENHVETLFNAAPGRGLLKLAG